MENRPFLPRFRPVMALLVSCGLGLGSRFGRGEGASHPSWKTINCTCSCSFYAMSMKSNILGVARLACSHDALHFQIFLQKRIFIPGIGHLVQYPLTVLISNDVLHNDPIMIS